MENTLLSGNCPWASELTLDELTMVGGGYGSSSSSQSGIVNSGSGPTYTPPSPSYTPGLCQCIDEPGNTGGDGDGDGDGGDGE